MTGLRIFINPDTRSQGKHSVFYSQRSNGPIYRWHYEEHLDRWHGVRLDVLASSSRELCAARWHSVPPALKAQLNEHYVE